MATLYGRGVPHPLWCMAHSVGIVGTWRAASVSGVAPRFMITPHVCHNLFNRGNRMCEMTDAARDVRTA